MNTEELIKRNKDYWEDRAPGYTKVNLDELGGPQKEKWKSLLVHEIESVYGHRDPADISILDIGCGPGFFSIILTEAGYRVTSVDLTESMIAEARQNAGPLAERITFFQMNAQELEFGDGTFDVVLSRNLTWNLPEPDRAYGHWCRVLRPGGLFLNFDANWYTYLFDEQEKADFQANRKELVEDGFEDYCEVTDEDTMEDIARRMPLGKVRRPQWDGDVLGELGMQEISTVWDIAADIWSYEEKRNYALTPMFMVRAVK